MFWRREKSGLAGFGRGSIIALVFSLTLFILIPTLWAEPAVPQQPTGSQLPSGRLVLKAEPIRIQFSPQMVRLITRNALPFRKFTLEELGLSSQKEVVFKNGNRMNVEDYLNQLNQLEQEFNKLGYSLRQPGEVVLQKTVLNKDIFERTRKALIESHLQEPSFFVPSPDLLGASLKTAQKGLKLLIPKPLINPAFLDPDVFKKQMEQAQNTIQIVEKKLAQSKPQEIKPLKIEKRFSKELGAEDEFAVKVEAGLIMNGRGDRVDLTVYGKGTGYVMGKSAEVLDGKATMFSSKDKANATVKLRAIGYDILDESWDTFYSYQNSTSKSIDQSYTGSFTIGPIPVTVTLGFKGEVGIDYGFCMTPNYVSGIASPYVDSGGYAEAGVGLEFVNAGAGAELTFLKDRMNLQGELGIQLVGEEPILVLKYAGQNELHALDGKIYAYVDIDYWIGHKKFSWDIFEWDGVKTSGYILGPEEYCQSLISGQKFTKETVSVVVKDLKTQYKTGNTQILFGTSAYSLTEAPAPPTKTIIWFGKEIKWEKEIVPPSDKKVVIVMEVWGPRKPEREKGILEGNHRLNVDPNGGEIVLILDLEKGTFTGDATGKRGDTIRLKGTDGEIEFYIPLKFKETPAKAK